MAIQETIDLHEYQNRIEVQRKNLSHSLIFGEHEKAVVNQIYDEQQAICKKRIALLEENILADEN